MENWMDKFERKGIQENDTILQIRKEDEDGKTEFDKVQNRTLGKFGEMRWDKFEESEWQTEKLIGQY